MQIQQKIQELKDYYSSEIVERIEQIIFEQMRRYSYLF